MHIAISGAGSGIGHEFLKHFSSTASNRITAIDISWSEEVSNEKAAAHISRHTLDTSSQSAVDELASTLDKDGHPIDLFIHSAAVRGLVPELTKKSDNPSDAETLDVLTADVMMQTLTVNVLGGFLLLRALLPSLRAGEGKKCVVMGSRMGSIASNNDGGAYAYRASKAGLHALVKSFSIDVPEVVFTIIHPGRVDSRMTHVREKGAIDPDEAVAIMLPIIEKLGKSDSGKFYYRDGKELPW